jgi:hypothetical protein
LRVLDVDAANEREAEQPHRLLAVHQEDYARAALALQLRDLARAHRVHHALLEHGLKRREHEEEPKDVADRHGCLL